MRIHFTMELKNESIPIDYRRKFISYLKFCIEESNPKFYQELYGKGKNINKDFTMAAYFVPQTNFLKNSIVVKSKKVVLNLSTPDAYLGVQFYNALCSKKHTWYPFSKDNAIRLVEIHSEREKLITQRQAVFNTLSPIIIRDHDRDTGKDWFYTFEDEEAVSVLKRNLKGELTGKFDRDISQDIEQLEIEFLHMKKVVIKSYELKIPCSLGTFKMEGESYLLQYLYLRGVGGKRSLGFSYLELL
ncbi:CRISPR-associated endoribonuclease Cas6 [Cellulosilyticum sp. I15G10I2]|uniref:CRISPR-associated endoribonuclease Cas6 n=1 Tax=Cellulosilyticum sp. I15G10I2 TaxID=1892843 RepID=UPI00085C215E|nr:CRISPR-associated endoribonuclease Cas6 [Cellulosilyticum sp. I15G10I2]